MKRYYEAIYESYFKTVYALVYRYYPKDADTVTAEVFKHKIFKAVEEGYFKNCMVYVVNETTNYCAMKCFEAIYCRYFETVYGIAYRHHPDNVDDVVAEIFEKKILKAIYKGRIKENKDYTAYYIIRIAINQCHSIYRRNKSRQSKFVDERMDLEISEADTSALETLDPSSQIDIMIDFFRALDYLTKKQYLVMTMTIEGYTDEEIAKEMNTSDNAVRMLRSRARQKLRKILR